MASKTHSESSTFVAAPEVPDLPPRRILVISTVGGPTNSAPLLEICQVLHRRGHTIEFATLEGGSRAVKRYPFIKTVHYLGRGLTPEEEDQMYTRASKYTSNTNAGRANIYKLKTFLDGFWVENYPALKKLVTDFHFDLIFSDYQMDAAKDVMLEHNIPLAQMWPQSPLLLAPQTWIPGEPFLQQKCLTNENASLYHRLFEMTSILRGFPYLAATLLWTIRMRRKAGVKRMVKLLKKPDHLVLINSFFGLEVSRDLPPLMNCVGPILSDQFLPLDDDSRNFLESHSKIAFVALGTHVRLQSSQFERLVSGLMACVESGILEGVIWAMQTALRHQIDATKPVKSTNLMHKGMTYQDLLNNGHPHIHFVDFAPQRAVLSHPNTRVFVTHCGASSANEGVFHGVPMLTMAIYSDQIPSALRLRTAGVALSLEKFTFTPEEVHSKVTTIIEDKNAAFERNCLRLKRIARIASRNKERAANLIEEHMYGHELRFDPRTSKALSPMHLQTPDARMSIFRAHNWDIMLLFLLIVGAIVGLVVGLVVGLQR